MHGVGTYYYSQENYFYSGGFREGEETGRGLYFYSDSQDFYMGEVLQGEFNGKGLFYQKEADCWELNVYKDGQKLDTLKQGQGRPTSLSITKEQLAQHEPEEIYIKPKDLFFDHYEVSFASKERETSCQASVRATACSTSATAAGRRAPGAATSRTESASRSTPTRSSTSAPTR